MSPRTVVFCLSVSLGSLLCGTPLSAQSSSALNWRILPDRCNDVELSAEGDVLSVQTTGKDPFLIGDLVGVGASDTVLEFEYFATKGTDRLELFLGPPFGPNSRAFLPAIPVSETWQTYAEEIPESVASLLAKRPTKMRLDLGKRPGLRLQLRGWKLRRPTQAERERKAVEAQANRVKRHQSDQIQTYLETKFPYRIDSVRVTRDAITLSGKPLPAAVDLSKIRLVECPIWASVNDADSFIEVDTKFEPAATGWTVQLSRAAQTWDRLHSSWQLTYDGKPITARKYATVIDSLVDDYPASRPMPTNQKGMGGFVIAGPIDELVELGVTAITLNMPISGFVSTKPGPGRQPIDNTDPIVYFNDPLFAKYDKATQWARKHQIIVTGILLVNAPDEESVLAPMVHPEREGGKYAMPDLTTQRGATVYAYVLDRLAKRYRSNDRPPGGITNWIAHNEIDQHYSWTNMGVQPRDLVTDTYCRSMRMISAAVRSYNPHARVFASLTHHWMVPDDGKGKHLSPRDFLVNVQRYSVLEGDFPWGVAYHPYPQSLFSETAWNDTKVTDDYTTPMITIQNLEVLNRFMSHPKMKDSSGQIRGILLSEQGFHTDSYDAQSQANQAGSLAYAMRKLRSMPAIESFHYHRWVDHPKEGGLKMGLRTLPTKDESYGRKKQAWEVYKAIGTPSEADATASLPGPSAH